MSGKPNVKLSVTFEFDLLLPESLTQGGHEALCKQLHQLLGSMVFQGMPTVTGKQLAQAGGRILAHHHHLDATDLGTPTLAPALLAEAAPHLTDEELLQLVRRAAGRLPSGEEEQRAFLRRQALALVNEYRMVPCVVSARLTSGADAELAARLNLTNGSVLVGERDRQQRLHARQEALEVVVAHGEASARLPATCAGQTLSGPVIEVAVMELARHRALLQAAWQASEGKP